MWGAPRGGIQCAAVWMCSRTSHRPLNGALDIPISLAFRSYLIDFLTASQRLPGRISKASRLVSRGVPLSCLAFAVAVCTCPWVHLCRPSLSRRSVPDGSRMAVFLYSYATEVVWRKPAPCYRTLKQVRAMRMRVEYCINLRMK